ncbi:hypothetical protein EJD97_017341 [Solanum chilense]|uniref:Uncharacterized protein n=1 Tax=Solanum chilense TaxID=4083 RepID=A0A6N2B5L4_SOLCI|nr:hypothetical protein EJD97_017341 [Solanum chilense]
MKIIFVLCLLIAIEPRLWHVVGVQGFGPGFLGGLGVQGNGRAFSFGSDGQGSGRAFSFGSGTPGSGPGFSSGLNNDKYLHAHANIYGDKQIRIMLMI